MRDLKREHKDVGMAVTRAKKAAKNDGIDLDALKWLEKLAELDTDEAEMQLRHLQIYAKWIKLPIGMQSNMFGEPEAATVDAKAAAEQREWQAGDDGLEAGKGGRDRDENPHHAGSAEHVAWDKAWTKGFAVWTKGQKKLAGELAANAKANGELRPKRGRAAKAR
jgi:hypothetical protein